MSLSPFPAGAYFGSMEKRAKEILTENSLNPYERGVLAALQSRGSEAVKTKAISEAISNVMSGKVELEGEEVTVAEALTIKVVGEALANPTTGKLKDLATILGDVGATKVEIYQSAVDEDLARSALGEDPDGAE